MDAALVNGYITIIGQGYAKVKILGLLRSELTAGNLLIPGELGAGQTHFSEQEAHAYAGLIVGIVSNGNHRVQARTIGCTEGNPQAVYNRGKLIDDFQNLPKCAGIDIQLVQQVQKLLGAEQLPQLTHGNTVVEHLGQGFSTLR